MSGARPKILLGDGVRLLVQGWRGIPHSYAMVNQHQLLELAKRPGITLFHEDLPFHNPDWSRMAGGAGFSPQDTARIATIPPPDGPCDIVYRIAYPYRAGAADGARVFCFATCEYRRMPDLAGLTEADPATRFITPSHWSKAGLAATGVPPERISIAPHGVNTALFRPLPPAGRAAMRQRLNIAPENFVFLNVSAMADNKGVDLLLLAFAQVRRRHPHAKLLLKDQRNLYGQTAGDLIQRVLTHWPQEMAGVSRESVSVVPANLDLATLAALYGACDVYVSPYRAEGFNLPPLEAAACGLPIVVTAGGPSDDYRHESFALPVTSRSVTREGLEFLEPDLDSLIEAMLSLIERRAPHINAREATDWIGAHFTWAHAVDKMLDIFSA